MVDRARSRLAAITNSKSGATVASCPILISDGAIATAYAADAQNLHSCRLVASPLRWLYQVGQPIEGRTHHIKCNHRIPISTFRPAER